MFVYMRVRLFLPEIHLSSLYPPLFPNFRRQRAPRRPGSAHARAEAHPRCASLLPRGALAPRAATALASWTARRQPSAVARRRRRSSGCVSCAVTRPTAVLTRTPRSLRTVRTSLLCDGVPEAQDSLARGATHCTTPVCQPRACVTTGQRCAVVRLLVARPGAGRRGAGALDRPARRHQLEDRRVGVRRQQPYRGLPRRWV